MSQTEQETPPSDSGGLYKNWGDYRERRKRTENRQAEEAEEAANPPPDHGKPTKLLRNYRSICGLHARVQVVKDEYGNGGIALRLFAPDPECDNQWQPLLTATSWIPGVPEGCVAIKNYTENEGVLKELTNHGAIDDPHMELNNFPICKVLF